MEDMTCDVVVVGAGPGGSTAARAASEGGARVLLLERKAQIGVPERCAGYVAKAVRWHIPLPEECIAQPVDVLRTFLPDGTVHERNSPGYVLNRAALDRHLALYAVEAGARLLLRTTAVGRWDGGVMTRREGEGLRIHAPIIVGADGPRSLMARCMGLATPRLATALQYEVALQSRLSAAEVYFRPAFRGGYAWLFPSGRTARVGAAFVGGYQEGAAALRELLRHLEEEGRITDSAISFCSGSVPVGGPVGAVWGHTLLVGDAAAHTHPVTGAGIVNAIIAGEMAGRAAARAALSGDPGLLKEYQEEYQEVLGQAMEKARQKRACLEREWDSPLEHLSQTIRKSWIAFDEYYAPQKPLQDGALK